MLEYLEFAGQSVVVGFIVHLIVIEIIDYPINKSHKKRVKELKDEIAEIDWNIIEKNHILSREKRLAEKAYQERNSKAS